MLLIRLIKPLLVLLFIIFVWGMVLPRHSEGKTRPNSKVRRRVSVSPIPAATAKELAEPRVVVSDNHSVLLDEQVSLPAQLALAVSYKIHGVAATDEYLWTCFSLHSKEELTSADVSGNKIGKPVASLTVSAMGLGPVAFAVPDANGCPSASKIQDGPAQACKVFRGPGGGWTNSFGCWQSVLTLPLDQHEKVIGVRVPVGLVQQPGNAVEGKIIIDEAVHKALEIPLKIERPSDPVSTGFQWFFGIAIPALLSFGIGYVALKLNTRFSTRTEQLKAFRSFKDSEYDALDTFFTNFYSGAYDANPANPKGLVAELRKEMLKKKILSSIPQKERNRLEKALNLCQEKQIQESLGALFTEWRDSIESRKIANQPEEELHD
jgi:hypothetical protein